MQTHHPFRHPFRHRFAALGVLLATVAALSNITVGHAGAIGSITEYPLAANTGPQGIASGPDNNLWFVENATSKVAKVTTAGVVTEYALAQYSAPVGITAGPDGNLWFTETNKIGKITTAGVVTLYTLPSGGFPQAITPGPDGNLWFAENFRGAIGKITTAGVITQYSIPTRPGGGSSQPIGITAGPDGRVWFTESNTGANKIGAVTTSGGFTEYPVPTAGVSPSGIAAGPDGNVWFTETNSTNGNRIGRITTTGTVTEFPIPSANTSPGPIIVGPDGAMWFAETNSTASRIGRINTAGVITEYATPTTLSSPAGLAIGRDGNVWFTERAKSRIGRTSAAASNTVYGLQLASGSAPRTLSVAPGGIARFIFIGGRSATVTDASGMALFDSATRKVATSYSFTFTCAGNYAFKNTLIPTQTGTVAVPLVASATTGTVTTTFTLTWAKATPPTGYVVDVRVQRPGTTTYATWKSGVTTTSATFVPDAGVGSYLFQARLRKTATGAASGWSNAKTITVS
jgi:streptogramin lyase